MLASPTHRAEVARRNSWPLRCGSMGNETLGSQPIAATAGHDVLVQVRDLTSSGDQITDRTVSARLSERRGEIDAAISEVSSILHAAAASGADGFVISEIEATFGLTLGVEAGILVSKVSSQATLEVRLKVARTDG